MADKRRRPRPEASGKNRGSSHRAGQPDRRQKQRSSQSESARERSPGAAKKKRPAGQVSTNQRRRIQNGKYPNKKYSRKRAKSGFASWSAGKKAIAVLMGVLILMITATVAVIASKWGKIDGVELDPDKLDISEEAQISGTGYLQVALFGLDTRATDEEMGARSDTIMVASLNRETERD